MLQARADLAQYVAGDDRDGPSVATAAASVDLARAALAQAETAMALHTVGAPFDATALQVNIRPGEYVPAGFDHAAARCPRPARSAPRARGGGGSRYSASRCEGAGLGIAARRRDRRYVLRLLRVDPLVVPKTALTGAATERVDTRILRILYDIEGEASALYPGQQMDVFIPGASAAEAVAAEAGRRPDLCSQPARALPWERKQAKYHRSGILRNRLAPAFAGIPAGSRRPCRKNLRADDRGALALSAQCAADVFSSGSAPHAIRASIEIDVTDALARIRAYRTRVAHRSPLFHVFAVYCVSRAVDAQPAFNTYRRGDRLRHLRRRRYHVAARQAAAGRRAHSGRSHRAGRAKKDPRRNQLGTAAGDPRRGHPR